MKRVFALTILLHVVCILSATAQIPNVNPSLTWTYAGVNVAFHPDGKRVLTRDRYGATLCDLETKKVVRNYYKEHLMGGLCMFNRLGTIIITEGYDCLIHLIDTETGNTIMTLGKERPFWQVHDMALDSKEEYLIVSYDSEAYIWDLKTGSVVHKLLGNTGYIAKVAFNEERSKAITFGNGVAKIWDMQSGKTIHTIGSVGVGDVNNKGDRLLSSSGDGTISIWDVKTASELRKFTAHKNGHWINDLKYNRKNDKIISTSMDTTVKIWDAESGTLLSSTKVPVIVTNIKIFNNDNMFSTQGEDNTLYIFEISTGKIITQLKHTQDCLKRYVVSDYSDKVALICDFINYVKSTEIWDIQKKEVVFTTAVNHANFEFLEYNNSGTQVMTQRSQKHNQDCLDCSIKIWDTQTGELVRTLQHNNGLSQARYSPNGEMIATATDKGEIKLWDVKTGMLITPLKGHSSYISSLEFDAKGERIISSSSGQDNSVKVWGVKSGALLFELAGHYQSVTHAIFNSKGDRIVTGESREAAMIWDGHTGEILYRYTGLESPYRSIVCDNSGTRAAISSFRSATIIVNLYTGIKEAVITEKNYRGTGAEFSPDGEKIMTLETDSTAKIWDSHTGELLYVLRGQNDAISFASYNHKGDRIVTSSPSGRTLLWDANDGSHIATLTKVLGKQGKAKFSPDDKTVACAGNALKFWSVESLPSNIHEQSNERRNNLLGIEIKPNPAWESLTITLNEKSNLSSRYSLVNTLGKAMISGTLLPYEDNLTLNIQELSKGVYYFIVHNDEYTLQNKVIILD